ncbi:MAG: type II/IV secretion system protein [Phycisphaerales bacterium]|nr:type II/IV secretion system protein [Phycisphaerales bacterium]
MSTPDAPSLDFLTLIPRAYARRHLILSQGFDGTSEHLRISDTTDPLALFNMTVRLKRSIITRIEDAESLAAAIDAAYEAGRSASPVRDDPAVTIDGSEDVEHDLQQTLRALDRDLLVVEGKAPAVRLVDLILFEALTRAASDVHIQPLADTTLVRYRLDGAMHTVRRLPVALASAVVSRIKIMARLDVAERRAPQDGRAGITIGGSAGTHTGRTVDLRVSTLPSTYGERIVLRLLDPARSAQLLTLAGLGMPPKTESAFTDQLNRTSGIVLVTGPTGSGKTTTLYAALNWINAANAGTQARGCELNIMTVEDPVEYDLTGPGLAVSQTQVDPKKNVTFASGLRHILRQDPDVIMVGEIRDDETARMAVQASLTGHLVLSTLHTSDAASALPRLMDLGVEPFLVASSLSGVLAQRLVRRTHAACGGEGCPECFATGYKGRTGIFELLLIDHEIRELIAARTPALQLRSAARKAGMVTMRELGEALVTAGTTTMQELARAIEVHEEELA